MNKPTVLDLFAGAGGLSLGFEQAGYEIVGAIEQDKWCVDTLEANHKKIKAITADIRNISEEEIIKEFPNIDVVIGGPPCQGFSISNSKGRDPKDPRNSLFREFLRIISYIKPKAILMENVKGITTAKTQSGEKVIDIIEKELSALGYYVETHILFAADYGVPQMRERVFVIGVEKKPNKSLKPVQTHISPTKQMNIEDNLLEPYVTAWEAISDLPQIVLNEGDDVTYEYATEPHNDYQKRMRKNSKRIFNHHPMKHSKRVRERMGYVKYGNRKADIPKDLMPRIRNGGGELADKIYDQNHRRIHPDKVCYTIAASFYANFVHPFLARNITAREGARIQSFPDSYIFKGKKTKVSSKLLKREGREDEDYLSQYQQIGNAVPPLLAYALGKRIRKEINE